MSSTGLRARLEFALRERVSSPFTTLAPRVSDHVPTGIAPLDALIGGLPRGAITELFGPLSSGRTATTLSILARAAARDEACAFVDGADAFDPQSGIAAGLNLKKLLWVRCRTVDQVLKTADLLLQGGGFGCVVMDLGDLPVHEVRHLPMATWYRLQRAVEKTPTVLIVLNRQSMLKSAAALALRLETIEVHWSRLLDAIDTEVEVVRCRKPLLPALSIDRNPYVCLHFRSPILQ